VQNSSLSFAYPSSKENSIEGQNATGFVLNQEKEKKSLSWHDDDDDDDDDGETKKTSNTLHSNFFLLSLSTYFSTLISS